MENKFTFEKFTKSYWYKAICITFGVGIIFLIWLIFNSGDKTGIFPSISQTFSSLGSLLSDYHIYQAIGGTFLRLLIAFLISALLAFILGAIAGVFKGFEYIMFPIVRVLKTIPTAAVILFLIVLFKPNFSLLIILFLIMFPIMYESVLSGFQNVDQNVTDAIKLDSSKYNLKNVFKIYFPLSKNYIVLGIISCLALGMKVAIMSEVLIGTSSISGLGILIRNFSNETDMAGVFAISLISILIISILDFIVFEIKKRFKIN